MSPLKPCLTCGEPSPGSRCPPCDAERLRAKQRARGPRTDAISRRPWAWRQLSRRARAMSGFCERCGSTDPGALTTDHVQPTSHGGPMFPPLSGLRVLCRPCHGRVWAEQVAEQCRVSPPDVPIN